MTSDFSPEAVSSPVDHQPSWTTSPRPKEGSQRSSTAKSQMRPMPMRKVGSDTPTSDTDRMRWESQPLRLMAV